MTATTMTFAESCKTDRRCKWCGRGPEQGIETEPATVVGRVCAECEDTEREAQG